MFHGLLLPAVRCLAACRVAAGTALVDPFTFSSLSWTDDADALPLTYAFAYLAGMPGPRQSGLLR